MRAAGNSGAAAIPALVALVFLALFVGFVAFLAARQAPPAPTGAGGPGAPVGGFSAGGRTFVTCGPGDCAVDVYTGEKRCPAGPGIVLADAAYEVCSAEFACTSPIAPFPVAPDGGTTFGGGCAPGVACPCARAPRCPEFVVAAFRRAGSGPKAAVTQTPLPDGAGLTGGARPARQIYLEDPGSEACAIPFSALAQASPGCPGVAFGDVGSVVACLGLAAGCGGAAAFAPCAAGTLALLPAKALRDLREDDVFTSPYACVRGSPCGCGLLAVWDAAAGAVACLDPSQISELYRNIYKP